MIHVALSNLKPDVHNLLLSDIICLTLPVKACFITAFETYYESFKEEFFHLGFIGKPIEIEDLIKFVDSVTR